MVRGPDEWAAWETAQLWRGHFWFADPVSPRPRPGTQGPLSMFQAQGHSFQGELNL